MTTVRPRACVTDASFAVASVINEPATPAVRARIQIWEESDVYRIAPAIFAAENASVCRKHLRSGVFATPEDARRALLGMLGSVVVIVDDVSLAPRALEIATILGAGRAYDSMYLALAEREGVELWTGDQRFYNAAHAAFPFVRWVGEPLP